MFLMVTPIGSSATNLSAAAMAYVDYLCPAGSAPVEERAAVADYYAGRGSLPLLDGAGWWSGGGARLHELEGRVERADFAAMLMGRRHLVAERLVTARGSAGRAHLKVGNPTRLVAGQPVWSVSDATALVGSPIPIDALSGGETVIVAGTDFVTLTGMRTLLKTSDQK